MTPFVAGFADELVKVAAAPARSILTPHSSNVRGFRYDPATKEMFVTFKGGGTYRYSDVPPAAARSISRSKSVGKAVNKHLKGGGYAYEKVGMPATAIAKIVRRTLEKDPDRVARFIGKTKFPAAKRVALAVKADTRADKKLQRYSDGNGKHLQARGVPTFPVPSQSSGSKTYDVKYHPDIDRFTCNCGDWIHKRSWRQGQQTRDCKHIWLVKNELKNQGVSSEDLTKQAAAIPDGYVLSRRKDKDHNVIDVHCSGKNVGWLTSHPGSDGDYTWIKGMYVSPEHRGKGLSHALLQSVVDDHPNKELRLRARPFRDEGVSLDGLKKLYESHGFRQYDDENRMVRPATAAALPSMERMQQHRDELLRNRKPFKPTPPTTGPLVAKR